MATNAGTKSIFKAVIMNPFASNQVDSYAPGFLVIAGEKVDALTRTDPRAALSSAEFIDLGKKMIVPGFVDTHVHLPQFAIMGIGSGELLEWLNTYTYPEETKFADPEYAAAIAQKFFDALIAQGTTTAAIYSSVHEQATDIAFAAAHARGLRAFIGKTMMDRNSPPALLEETGASIDQSIRLFEKWDGADDGRLRYVFTPRFAGSCSMELMRRVGQFVRERNAYVQTHLSENVDEVKLIRTLFPDCPSYAAVYESAGLLSARCIMAHCIHLSADEIALLSRTRTNVAFCPYSNRTLRSGTMPYAKLRDAGLTISLATDVAGGPSLSMLEQMKEAMAAAGIAWPEALYLATLGGAKVLGLSDRIGNFEPGKDADFVVIDQDAVERVYIRGKEHAVASN